MVAGADGDGDADGDGGCWCSGANRSLVAGQAVERGWPGAGLFKR